RGDVLFRRGLPKANTRRLVFARVETTVPIGNGTVMAASGISGQRAPPARPPAETRALLATSRSRICHPTTRRRSFQKRHTRYRWRSRLLLLLRRRGYPPLAHVLRRRCGWAPVWVEGRRRSTCQAPRRLT